MPRSNEIRTPDLHLLIGTVSRENGRLYLVIKHKGKIDRIAIESLLSDIYEADKTSLAPSNHI